MTTSPPTPFDLVTVAPIGDGPAADDVRPSPHSVPRRILLADDNADMRDDVRRLLVQGGHEVETVGDGLAALDAARRRTPDLVLSDVMMPGLDGFGLLRSLRSDPALGGVPVILLSARSGEEARIEGMQAGADDCLIKPFGARELLARVDSHLAMARLRREATEALRHRAVQFETLLRQVPLGVYMVDADFRIREVNPVALPVFGDIPGGVIGRDFDEIIHILWPRDYADEIVRVFRRTLETGESHVTPERTERRADRGVAESYDWRIDRIALADGRFGVACYFRDISDRKRAEQTARRLASIVESSDDAIVSKDLDGVIVSWNGGAERLFGYTADEAVGRPIVMLIPPERQDEDPEILGRIRRGVRVEHYETVRRRKDGTLIDISLTVSPVRDGEGRVIGASKIARDISQRKRDEKTRQLLLGELNHRVKNTLAIVQAVVQRTLSSTKDPADFAARISGRIQSLARAHSLLTDATWEGADLRALVRDQLLDGAVDETRLTAWGPAVQLAPQMTLRLALMLHELGTNSLKHGALSTPAGWIAVGWSIRSDQLQLRWEERGGPPVRGPFTRGFGTTLIDQSARSEGGSAEMSVEAQGIVWHIVLPLPPAAGARSPAAPAAPELVGPATRNDDGDVAAGHRAMLSGMRILVIEDEPLIALALAGILESAGAKLARPVGTEREALEAIERSPFDAALLDGNLHGETVGEIAAALTRRNVPFVFVTGYGQDSLPGSFRHVGVVTKPFSDQQLLEAVAGLSRRGEGVVRLRPQGAPGQIVP